MHAVLQLFRPLPNIDIQNFDMSGMCDLAKSYRNIQNPLPNWQVEDWEAINGCTKRYNSTVSQSMTRCMWVNTFVPNHLGCGTDPIFIRFCRSHKYFKGAKVMQTRKVWLHSLHSRYHAANALGRIPATIRSRLVQTWSCDPDQPTAFHKQRSQSAHQIKKIRKQAVYCQLSHDINHSLGNFELKLHDCGWMKKRQTDVIYSWRHNGRWGKVIYVCRYESITVSSVHTHGVVYDTTWFVHAIQKVSRLRLYKMRVLKYYVENKAQLER